MLDGQHGILVTEEYDIIEMGYNATPKDLAYAMERNHSRNPKEFRIIPTGEEYNEIKATEIIECVHTITKMFGNKLGIPLYDKDYEAVLMVGITAVLVNQ